MRRSKGQGTVWQRPGGFWEGEISLGSDEVTGKRIKKYASGKTPEEVLDKLASLREEYLRASSQVPPALSPTLTLRAFVEQYWEPGVRLSVSARTLDRMLLDAGYVLRYLGNVPLGEITTGRILQMMSLMTLDGLSDYQRFKGLKMLRRIMAHAVRMDFLLKSPAHGIPLPRYEEGEIKPMTPEQVQVFLDKNREGRMYALWVVALDTGAREGELFALEWGDWNPERRELAITKSLETHRGRLRVKEPKTRAGKRTVVVSGHTWAVLEARKAQGGTLIFPAPEGGYLRKENFHRTHWRPALKRAGLEGFRFHDLRHTTATLLLMDGDSPVSIAHRLGHSNPKQIWDTYGHVIPQMRRESGERMGKYLKKD